MAYAATTGRAAANIEKDVRKQVIEQIAMDTPFTSSIVKKGPKPLETTPEWQVKTYASPSKTAVVEGTKPGTSDFQNNLSTRKHLKGRFIKLWRPVAVTKEQKLMGGLYNGHGTLADNILDKTKELNVDVEYQSLSDDEATAPSAGVTASSGRSLFRWISNDNARFTDTDTTPDSSLRTSSSAIVVSKTNASDVAEPEIQGMITAVATARKKAGMRFMGLCPPLMRDQFDSFSKLDKQATSSAYPVSQWNQTVGTINREVTFYRSSNGSVELITSFQMDSTVHFGLITPDMVEIRYAQGVMVNPDTSSSSQVDEREIDVIYVLECLNPQAHGKVITGATA